jgi:CBS domain-containing protein
MDQPTRRPEEILAFHSLRQILASKSRKLLSAGPADTVLSPLQIRSDKDVGCLVVLERNELVGIVSERDCARRVVLAWKPPETRRKALDILRDVITCDGALRSSLRGSCRGAHYAKF